jgi:hypothetical protein
MVKMQILRVRLIESEDGIDPFKGLMAEVGSVGRYLKEDNGCHVVVVPEYISGFRHGEIMRTIRFYANDPNEFEKFGETVIGNLRGTGYEGLPEPVERGVYDFFVADKSVSDVINILSRDGKTEVLGREGHEA